MKKRGPKMTDLTGQRAGRLLIINRAENGKYGQPRWNCVCECGNKTVVYAPVLRKAINPDKYSPRTRSARSCGCFQKEVARNVIVARCTTHGQSGTTRYMMWASAKRRAVAAKVPFGIEFDDFPEIPAVCPALGIPLSRNTRGGPCSNSPSLDRIIPALGYVKGNVRIISHRANTIKSDATLEEILAVARYIADTICVVH